MLKRFGVGLGVAALLGASPLQAQVIDQSQPVDNTGFAFLSKLFGVSYQTFMPTMGNVSGAGFFLDPNYRTSGLATIFIQLLDSPGGTVLASGSQVINSNGWVDVFWAPVNVTPGNSYAVSIYSDEPRNGGGYVDGSSRFNPYAGGQAYYIYAGNTTPTCCGPAYDLTFREYSSPVTTPEPATLALLGPGFIGLAGVAIRRRKRTS